MWIKPENRIILQDKIRLEEKHLVLEPKSVKKTKEKNKVRMTEFNYKLQMSPIYNFS